MTVRRFDPEPEFHVPNVDPPWSNVVKVLPVSRNYDLVLIEIDGETATVNANDLRDALSLAQGEAQRKATL